MTYQTRTWQLHWLAFCAVALLTVYAMLPSAIVSSQEPAQTETETETGVEIIPLDKIPLLEREPFDRLSLDEESEFRKLDIVPLTEEEKKRTNGRLIFVLIDDPDAKRYQVNWKHVVKIETYPELILTEANRLMALKPEGETADKQALAERKNLVEAFKLYDFLMQLPNYRDSPELKKAVNFYLYTDAFNLIKKQQLREALSVVEELYKRDKTYQPPKSLYNATKLLENILGRLIDQQIKQHEYRLAERYMDDIDERYGEAFLATTKAKRDEITKLALEFKTKAEGFLANGEGRKARDALRQMRNISPNLDVGSLEAEILRRYPMVLVGVNQKAISPDPKNMHNLAARRVGKLLYRTLVEYRGQGEDGGIYGFPQGRIERADDWRSMDFVIREKAAKPGMPYVDGHMIAQRLLTLADRRSPEYLPAWAALLKSVEVKDAQLVHIELKHSHVLPEALLQIPIDEIDLALPRKPNGFYVPAGVEENDEIFEPIKSGENSGLDELPKIIERYYANSSEMVADLKRGDLDVIDRIFPGEYRSLRQHPDIVVERYAIPTTHMLIPNWKNEHMRNAAFRKVVLNAIDRQTILDDGLLAGADIPGCQVISGPFPLGINENDPISYGYNLAVLPARADYYLAVNMFLLAEKQIKQKRDEDAEREAAERAKNGEPPLDPPVTAAAKEGEPKAEEKPAALPRRTIVIAYPQNDVAAVACELIAQQLGIIGIEAKLRELPPGVTVPPDADYDLLYAEIVMEEPLVGARAFLVESKLVYDLTSPVEHALRELDGATSWSDARRRLHDLHFQCDSESIILPLWQMTEHYAYRKNVAGLGKRVGSSSSAKSGVTNFYENVDRWRIVPEQAGN